MQDSCQPSCRKLTPEILYHTTLSAFAHGLTTSSMALGQRQFPAAPLPGLRNCFLPPQAVSFVESRLYNAFLNNCIQNTDFLVRVLTGGAVRNAPLIFDALCGHVPPQDNHMLLMFMLMTRMSWYAILASYLRSDSACSIRLSVDCVLPNIV